MGLCLELQGTWPASRSLGCEQKHSLEHLLTYPLFLRSGLGLVRVLPHVLLLVSGSCFQLIALSFTHEIL